MPGPYDFTGQNIENTYQRVVQTPDGVNFYDGTGSLLPLSSSFISGASAIGSTITFTRGDGSTFPVTVAAGTGTPGGPEQSLQFNSASVFSGSNNLKFDYTNNNIILTGSILMSGSSYISGVDYIDFDTTASNVGAVGRLKWNDQDGTLDLGLKGGNVTLQIGQEEVVRVVNKSGTNLTEAGYQAVRVSGAQGGRVKVALAKGDGDGNSIETLGLVTEDIALNQEGYVTVSGLVRGINTSGVLQGETWNDGDPLYLSPTVFGGVTKNIPTAPSHSVRIGYVVQANPAQGSIFVKVDNGYELDELHNVNINTSSLSHGDLLIYDSNVWYNSKQLSGSYGLTGSLNATSFTGSLFGTSSWANSASVAISSSFALSSSFAQTASYVSTLRAAGLNTQIQFNSGSLLSGSQYFRYIYQSQSLEHGASVTASGQYSHAEGTDNIASGDYSHAEGRLNSANGFSSHAEGYSTVTNGAYSHTEGSFTSVNGDYSHAEGFNASVPSNYSHAEGFNTIALGQASHAEGHSAITLGEYSHAEGYNTTSSGQFSHAEGNTTTANGVGSHAEGFKTSASADYSHAEGTKAIIYPEPSINIGSISGSISFDFGTYTLTDPIFFPPTTTTITVDGDITGDIPSTPYTVSFFEISDGTNTIDVNLNYYNIIIDSVTYDGFFNVTFLTFNPTLESIYYNVDVGTQDALGLYSHTEGYSCITYGIASHAEGYQTIASGNFSHAEGNSTQTIGSYSHAEGFNTTAYGDYSHAEGNITIASGSYSHAEGDHTIAKGDYSHAEGSSTQAIGLYSHASGFGTVAYANRSFTAGELTIASGSGQVAIGILNTQNNTTDLFVIGNGYTDPFTLQLVRRDIFNVSTSSVIISGSVNISGSLNVNNGITGSLFGTASWASQAISSSFATLARSSSFINTLGTNTNAVFYPTFVDSNNSPAQFEQLYSDRNQYLTYNPSSGYLTSFIFSSSADPLAVGFVGTSSWAQNAINAQTASFLPVGTYQITSSWAVSASRAISSSFATNASIAQTASFVNTITTSSNALFPIVFVDSNNGSLTPEQLYTDGGGGLTYTPLTGLLKATIFDGDLSGTADTASYVNGNIFTGANPALTASYALTTAGGGPGGDTTAIEAQFWFLL